MCSCKEHGKYGNGTCTTGVFILCTHFISLLCKDKFWMPPKLLLQCNLLPSILWSQLSLLSSSETGPPEIKRYTRLVAFPCFGLPPWHSLLSNFRSATCTHNNDIMYPLSLPMSYTEWLYNMQATVTETNVAAPHNVIYTSKYSPYSNILPVKNFDH